MSADLDWQPAFLAVSTLLGEPADVASAALGNAAGPEAAGLLGSGPRAARAAAVARVVAGLLADLERARLA
jgi:hypothetical protein